MVGLYQICWVSLLVWLSQARGAPGASLWHQACLPAVLLPLGMVLEGFYLLTSHVESQGPPAMVVPLQASNTRTMSVDLEEAQGLPSSILRLLCWTREGLPKPPKPKHCTLNQGGMKEQI